MPDLAPIETCCECSRASGWPAAVTCIAFLVTGGLLAWRAMSND